jgi:hypothetical protein
MAKLKAKIAPPIIIAQSHANFDSNPKKEVVIKIKPTVIPVSFQFLEVSSLARQKPRMQVDRNSIQHFVVDFLLLQSLLDHRYPSPASN